jgi:hypothetical protein
VWWQCLAVAYAWKTKTDAAVFRDEGIELVGRLKAALVSWLPKFSNYITDDYIPEEVVIDTLAQLTEQFRSED